MKYINKYLQLQVTGLLGAEGKDHLVSLNSGEVKRVLMGSLAGPESPKPWSHNIKFRAMGFCSCEYDELGQKNRMNIMVPLKITVNRTIGFVNNIDSSLHFWSCFFYSCKTRDTPSLYEFLVRFICFLVRLFLQAHSGPISSSTNWTRLGLQFRQ